MVPGDRQGLRAGGAGGGARRAGGGARGGWRSARGGRGRARRRRGRRGRACRRAGAPARRGARPAAAPAALVTARKLWSAAARESWPCADAPAAHAPGRAGARQIAALGVRQAEEDAAVALLEGSGAGAQAAARAAELERKLHGARQVASQAARRRELPAGACCVHVVPGPSHLPRPAQPSSLRPKLQTHTACSQPRPGTAASMPHSASARHQGGPARTVPDGSAAGCAYGI